MQVAVVGATGYTGIELIRCILDHPRFALACATSTRDHGKHLSESYPALLGSGDVVLSPYDADTIANQAELVFLAVPHTKALTMVPELLKRGCKVVDLSADYRLKDAVVYEQWYETPHTSAELLERAVYGLPELMRSDIALASLVACPGCYPTATALAVAPALEAGLLEGDRCVVTALSGVSGAGKTPSAKTNFCSANESVNAYAPLSHRHTPEIAQTLSAIAGHAVGVSFVPHLVPMNRGLLSTVHLTFRNGVTIEKLYEIYQARYASEPFVTVLENGAFPATGSVQGTNRVQVGLTLDEATGSAVVSAAIDNLMKGASGQAIQCANIMAGFDETAGLTALGPIL